MYGYKEDTLVYNTFAPNDITGIISRVGNLTILIGFILVFSMIYAANKISSTSINPVIEHTFRVRKGLDICNFGAW